VKDLAPAILLPATAVAAALLVSAVRLVLRLVFRRSATAVAVVQRIYRPAQVMVTLATVRLALALTGDFAWRAVAAHGLVLATITAGAWLTTRLLRLLRRTAERAYHGQDDVDQRDRLRRTQINVLYRTGYSAIWLVAIALMLMTFPGVRAIGTSLLASAGVAGIIIGLAAQAMLKNLFAGLSLAFGDSIRLGDVVEIEGEWGRVEDIALSYVVVRIWDDRRLILPTSYFTDNPHRNWTRESPDVLGTVELDVGWRLPMAEVRAELARIVEISEYWDGRICSVAVVDATGPLKRIRPLVSASTPDNQWSLRCEVREKLIDWIAVHYPDCMPSLRVAGADAPPDVDTAGTTDVTAAGPS
jgi:small-conductance mechanosensitive channel